MTFRFIPVFLLLLSALSASAEESTKADRASMILCAGVGGTPDYTEAFSSWAAGWQKAATAAGAELVRIGFDADSGTDLEKLGTALKTQPRSGTEPLWIVLLGHGTFDGHEAKFNLRGTDLSAGDLASLIEPFERPVIIIAAFSSSGAFLAPLSKRSRIVVTATRSGAENNFSRLGKYLSESIADPAADLDHDGQTSLLEAWLSATRKVADFYKSEGRLATEHSLLDDNGDQHGTPADWFSGLKVVKKSSEGSAPDGLRAHQIHLIPSEAERRLPPEVRAKRDTLELELADLRAKKAGMPEVEYFTQLEEILRRIAALYHDAHLPEAR